MLQIHTTDNNDGSRRLFSWACRAVEHDLSDSQAIAAIRASSETRPFPQPWKDTEIVKRLRHAETTTTRGLVNLNIDLWKPEGRTDAANARRLAATFGDVIRWCDPWRKWLIWDGCRWNIDDRRCIDSHAKVVAKKLWDVLITKEIENSNVYGFLKATNSAHGIRSMVSLARSEPGIPIHPDLLDQDHFLLNVSNGTIDLHSGELRPHCNSDYCTKLAPVDYDPKAECPLWRSFVERIFDKDEQLIGFIQRLCGYCLTGDVSEQIVTIFHGSGANGKSTLLNVLRDVLGDYAFKATEGLLLDNPKDSHPTSIADLAGKRLAIASETSDGAHLAVAKVKELTGGDTIRARRMREDNWEFNPTHKILLATNHRPLVRDTGHAIWRRMRLVPCDVQIPDAEQDKQLPSKLRAEYPGILRWIVQGCLKWQTEGLGVPPKVEEATANYRASEDDLTEFLETCCETGPGESAGASELLKSYTDFSGDRNMTAKRFAGLLSAHGYTHERATAGQRKGCKIWRGIRLAAPPRSVELARTPTIAVEGSSHTAA